MTPTKNFSPRSPSQQTGGNDGPPNPRNNRLSGRIESFREVSALDFSNYDDHGVSPPQSPTLKGRESLVSLQSRPSASSLMPSRSGSVRWTDALSSSHRSYHQVAGSGDVSYSAHVTAKRRGNAQQFHNTRHSGSVDIAIVEEDEEGRESVDIALLSAAAPISGTEETTAYPPITLTPDAVPKQVDRQTKEWQEQEQAGQLTGGLGAGFRPASTIREEELLSPTSPAMKRTMSFSLRNLSRSATVKVLGQNEADRTGQPVQVIIEDAEAGRRGNAPSSPNPRDSRIDLSFVAGDEAPVAMEELRSLSKTGTMPTVTQRVETFYPQPDWKPFSMRRPYLLTMILLSVLLAVFIELLYQHSARDGLVTFTSPSDIAGIKYFAIKFLPTIMAVMYGVLWQMTEFEVKRLEPFYQLSKDQGATAAESLNVDYITSVIVFRPLQSLRRRHYAVSIATFASLLAVSAVPTLSTAMIVLSPDRETRLANPGEPKTVSINATWSRFLESVLILTAILGTALLFQLGRRRSGLLADVKGIAGLAAMANVSHILMDFKDMDVATHEDIHRKLANRRYQLRNSALVPIAHDMEDESKSNVTKVVMGDHPPPIQQEDFSANFHLSISPHPLMFRKRGAVPFIAGVIIFTVFLPLFLFTSVGNFLDVVPWTVTLLAVCIKLAWGALDTTTRLMEPFYLLYRRHAPSKTLTLDYTAMPFAWVAIQALLNGHYLVFAVGFGTVMTEILTVLVSSLATVEGSAFALSSFISPSDHQNRASTASSSSSSSTNSSDDNGESIDAGEETVHSFYISLTFAMFILVYMALVASLVFLRRHRPFLPRQPNTIASVLGYIHQSKMLYDFVGTEKKSNAEVGAYLEKVGKTYGLGWFEGRDGRIHCGVDQEEMSASYRHGIDYRGSNMPWLENFEEL